MHLRSPTLLASWAFSTLSVDAQTGNFFVNWVTNKCDRDCLPGTPLLDDRNQCVRQVTEGWITLHPTVDLCCTAHFNWNKQTCLLNSNGGPPFTDKFYVLWATETCVKDCDPAAANADPLCNGNPPPDTGIPPAFFNTPQECCANKLWWIPPAACAGTGNNNNNHVGNLGGVCAADSDCTQVCTLNSCSAPLGGTPPCTCTAPKTVPNQCEVDLLTDMLDIAASFSREMNGRWLRAAFHDAGTFDQDLQPNGQPGTPEGGANGCLINEPQMRNQGENFNLDSALNALEFIKTTWTNNINTCVDISSADIIQFAGLFAATRQTGVANVNAGKIDQTKRDSLINNFQWGRPDEPVATCDLTLTDNLPGFRVGSAPTRCTAAGNEIKEKMMNRNSFTAEEATALIGAHTIGLVRDTFGRGFAGPWVLNGADDFTFDGPVFDNQYFKFGINTIVENTCPAFANNNAPFTRDFGDWFRQANHPTPGKGLVWLDTDISIVMPSENPNLNTATGYPNFHAFSAAFAADNSLFLSKFFAALDKLSKLGVDPAVTLSSPGTTCGCGNRRLTAVARSLAGVSGLLTTEEMFQIVKGIGDAKARAIMTTIAKQNLRLDEVKILTTPSNLTQAPTEPPSQSVSNLNLRG